MTVPLFGHTLGGAQIQETSPNPVQFLLYNGGAPVTQHSVFLVSLIVTDSRIQHILICLLHRATHLSTAVWNRAPSHLVASMPIAQPTGPVPCASADLTMRETRSSSATSTPASKAPVESTLIARLMDSVLSVGAEPTTLGTPSLPAALSHAQQVPVEQMLTARLRGKQPSANVSKTMWAIRTPTVGSIPARALLADRRQSARTMVEQQFASALLSTSETHMFLVVWTPAFRMPVVLTQIVPGVDRELFVHVGPATWAPPTAGPAAVPTLVSQGSAAQAPIAKMLEGGPSVSASQATRETLTQDASR